MKKIYLVLAVLITMAGKATAQVTIASVPSCTAYTLTATLSGLTPINSDLYSDDSYSGVIPIGFTFNYYGTPYTQLVIGENGQLTFDPTLAGGYDPWPISAALLGNSSALNTVCAPWCDIESTGPPTDPITYSTQGTAPNRTFAATWCGDHMFSCTAQWTTTQIVLYESTGVVEAHIGHKTVCAGWNGGYAIVGVQNASGSAATVAPGRDYPSVWTATNEAWRFTPAGAGSYTVSSITYAPIPYAASAVYWYNSTTGAYLGTGATIVVSPTVTTTYEAAAIGCLDTSKGFITLAPASGGATGTVVSTTGSTSLCVGGTLQLADTSAGGTWSSGTPGVASINATGLVSGLSAGTALISYTHGACTSTLIVTVNVGPPITGIMGMCVGAGTTLGDASPVGTWTSSLPGVASISLTTGVVTGITAGTSVISYVPTGGCAVSAIVTVHPIPAAPVPNSPFSYCQFSGSGPVSATGTGLLWYGPGVTAGMSAGPTPSTSIAGTITYYVTQTSSFGCVSDSATDVITIIPQPSAPITHDTSYCQFYNGFILPLNYEVDSASGSALKWYTGAGSSLSGAPTPSTAAADYPGGTTWNVSQVVNGCESPKAPIKVTIIPTPKFDLVYRNWVCLHDSISLSYNLTGGSILVSPVYSWQLPIGASPANGTTASDPSIDVKFDAANVTYNIGYLTIGNLNGQCATTDTFTVRVIPLPYAQSYCKPDVCEGDTVSLSLSAQAPNAANFAWQIDGVSLSSSTALNIVSANSNSGGPYLVSWNTPGVHIISVGTTTAEGCADVPENDTINVHTLPNASFTIVPSKTGTLCLEDSILFKAALQDANVNYLWQPEHNFNNNNKGEIWGKAEQGRTDITLTVTDPFGCKASTDQQLSPDACCTVLFPTAFSPNGDGHNDQFKPIFNGYHNFHQFRIVNRWGQVIFESANSNPSWDGSFNGVPQDMGVYYYYIKYDCGGNTIEDRGDVTLVR